MELYTTAAVDEGKQDPDGEKQPLMPLPAPTADAKSHLMAFGEPETAQLPVPRYSETAIQ